MILSIKKKIKIYKIIFLFVLIILLTQILTIHEPVNNQDPILDQEIYRHSSSIELDAIGSWTSWAQINGESSGAPAVWISPLSGQGFIGYITRVSSTDYRLKVAEIDMSNANPFGTVNEVQSYNSRIYREVSISGSKFSGGTSYYANKIVLGVGTYEGTGDRIRGYIKSTNSNSWSSYTVDTNPTEDQIQNPIAISTSTNSHILWSNFNSNNMEHAIYASSWSISSPKTIYSDYFDGIGDSLGVIYISRSSTNLYNNYYINSWSSDTLIRSSIYKSSIYATDGVLDVISVSGSTLSYNEKDGSSFTSSISIASNSQSSKYNFDVIRDSSGNVHVAFLGVDGQVYYTTKPNSGSWSTPTNLNFPSGLLSASKVAIKIVASGNNEISIVAGAQEPTSGEYYGIYYRKFNAATVPSSPSNLSATAGDSQVSLSWSTPSSDGGSSITGYKIYRSTTSGSGYSYRGITTSANYIDSPSTNGVTYYYVVRAVNAVGDSINSNQISSTPATSPQPPTSLVETSSDGQVSLVWNAPVDDGGSVVTGYNIYRSTTSGSGYSYIANTATTSYIDSTVVNGNTYYYVVRAVNTMGESTNSNEDSATPNAITSPSSPNSLASTDGDAQVSLTWSIPTSDGGSAITGYKVYRSANSGSGYVLISSPIVNSYSDTSVTNGLTYYYVVTAINSIGESSYSNEVSGTPISTLLFTLSSPDDKTISEGINNNKIVWSATASDPDVYEITMNGIVLVANTSWTSGDISLSLDGLLVGIKTFIITIYNLNMGILSDTVTITVVDDTPPTINSPADFNYTVGDTGNVIVWTVYDTNEGTYTINRDQLELVNSSWISGTIEINVDGLTAGTYNFLIKVYDEFGNFVNNTVIITTIDENLPVIKSAPDDVTIALGEKISLSWVATDNNPEKFTISFGSQTLLEGEWYSGVKVDFDLSSLKVGEYDLIIKFIDTSGNFVEDEVKVIIVSVTFTNVPEEVYIVAHRSRGVTLSFDWNFVTSNEFSYFISYDNTSINALDTETSISMQYTFYKTSIDIEEIHVLLLTIVVNGIEFYSEVNIHIFESILELQFEDSIDGDLLTIDGTITNKLKHDIILYLKLSWDTNFMVLDNIIGFKILSQSSGLVELEIVLNAQESKDFTLSWKSKTTGVSTLDIFCENVVHSGREMSRGDYKVYETTVSLNIPENARTDSIDPASFIPGFLYFDVIFILFIGKTILRNIKKKRKSNNFDSN